MSSDFFKALESLQDQGKRIPLPEDSVIKAFLRSPESFSFTEATPEIEQRALGTQTYLVVYPNQVSNGSFETDLTGWIELIESGVTAATQQTTAEGKTVFGSLGSLEVDVTASTAANAAGRYQDITAAVGEVWNFEAWLKGSAFTNARMELFIQWLDGADAEISSAVATSSDVGGSFVQLKLENQTAPASTAKVRVHVRVLVTTIGGTGKAWFDLARAEKGATTITDRARRGIAGECVART